MILYKGTTYSLRFRKLKTKRSLFIEYIDGRGDRVRESLNTYLTPNKRDTIDDKEKIDIAIAKVKDMELKAFNTDSHIVKKKKKSIYLLPYIESYLSKRKDLKPASRKKYKHLSNHIKKHFGEKADLVKMGQSDAEGFKYYLIQNLSQGSADQYFSAFKTIIKEAKKEKLIHEEFTQYIKGIGIKRSLPKYLLQGELDLLIKADCEHSETKRAFLFSVYTGLRFIDVYNLTYQNISEENGNRYVKITQQKTSQDISIPLNRKASALIDTSNMKSSKVFDLWKYDHTTNIIKRWVKAAGIDKNITFHVARHTFATLLLTNGADIYTVSKLLGHTDIKQTQIYAQVIDSKKIEAVDLL